MSDMKLLRAAFAMAAVLTLAACGGGGGDGDPPPASNQPPPPPPPPPAPPPPSGKWTVTLNNHVTASDVASGSVYGRVGDRAYARTELNSGDLLCIGQTGNRTCTVEVDAGKVLTLAAVEVADAKLAQIPSGGFTNPNWFKQLWQYVSWSAPCSEPERGVCVLQPTSNETTTVLWKPISVITIGFQGVREWRITVDAPAQLGLGSTHTGLRQRHVYEWPTQSNLMPSLICIGGPTPGACNLVQAPDATQITLEQLPSRFASPPMGASTLLQALGFGGACANASAAAGCTLSALGEQSMWFKWEHYNCLSAGGMPNYGWGLDGWKYQSTPTDCSLVVP